MNIRHLIYTAAAVAIAPAAFAATTPAAASSAPAAAPAAAAPSPAAQCDALQKQFQTASAANASNANLAKAKKTASDGESLCKNGKPADGVKKLQHALKDLGVQAH